MLVASLYFLESTTNTFQFPCGMITPTLFYVAAIISFRPAGEMFDPTIRDEDTINFDQKHTSFSKFIIHHHDTEIEEVSDKEHITFLIMLLSYFVFCCKSLKVDKRFLTLTNQLHDGRNICLGQLILGSLYDSLQIETHSQKNIGPSAKLLLVGPFWLLQLCRNARFESSFQTNVPNNQAE